MMPNYHESRTPQGHIDSMKSAVEDVKELYCVHAAHVDDWGRFSNFSIFVTVDVRASYRGRNHVTHLTDRQSLVKIKKKLMESLAISEPEIRVNIRSTQRNEGTYNLDVDFYKYSPESNTFPEKMPVV